MLSLPDAFPSAAGSGPVLPAHVAAARQGRSRLRLADAAYSEGAGLCAPLASRLTILSPFPACLTKSFRLLLIFDIIETSDSGDDARCTPQSMPAPTPTSPRSSSPRRARRSAMANSTPLRKIGRAHV